MRALKTLYLCFTISLCATAHAQSDFPVSLTTSLPSQISPARVAMIGAQYQVSLYNKNQFQAGPQTGIWGTGASFDYGFDEQRMGVGLLVYGNSLRKTAFRDVSVLISYAYRLDLDDHRLSLGLQGGVKQVGFNIHELTFGSQYDPNYQGGFDPSIQPSDVRDVSIWDGDVSAGLSYAWDGVDWDLTIDAAAMHLLPTTTTFLEGRRQFKPKYLIAAQAIYEQNQYALEPSILGHYHDRSRYIETGLMAYFIDPLLRLGVGVYYRTSNVIIPAFCLQYQGFVLRMGIECYVGNTFPQLFNVGVVYRPQVKKAGHALEEFGIL